MRELLGRRDFRRLAIGQTVSALGDWMGTVALMVLVLDLSGSSTAVAGVLVLRLLPSAVAAPIATHALTLWGRRQIMLGADLIRAGIVVLLPLLPMLGWVYVWAFAIEVAGLAFLPARDASVPAVAGVGRTEDRPGDDPSSARAAVSTEGDAPNGGNGRDGSVARRLELANGVMLGTSYATIPLGAGFFGLIVLATNALGLSDYWRYVAVFWIDAITYVISYFAIRGLVDLGRQESERMPAKKSGGVIDALRIPLVRVVLPAACTVMLGLGSLFSLGVVYVRGVLGALPFQFGVLVALFGVGAFFGLIALRIGPDRSLLTQLRFGILVQGSVIALMSVFATLPLAFAGAVLFGAAATATLVGGLTLVQESVAGAERDLALTAFHVVIRFSLAMSALLSGAAADLLRPVEVTGLGTVEPAQVVLLASGILVIVGVAFVKRPTERRREVRCQSPLSSTAPRPSPLRPRWSGASRSYRWR
ncbi:MAG: MFS transporter [Carbonactinosporaceae bacterium]